jgi:hypothetical protein
VQLDSTASGDIELLEAFVKLFHGVLTGLTFADQCTKFVEV